MRTSRNSKLIILHLVTYLLFLLPVRKLDLFKENYSTLSLNTKGYFFLFGLGILCGLVLGYDSYRITRDKRWGIAVFLGLFLGTCIPHEVPYHLRGNLHLFFAYTGGFILIVSTINNLFKKRKPAFTKHLNDEPFGVFSSVYALYDGQHFDRSHHHVVLSFY